MKDLSEIDKDYGKLIKKASVNQKLSYCASLIRRNESLVTNKRRELSEYSKKRSFALIIAAEKEIEQLSEYS